MQLLDSLLFMLNEMSPYILLGFFIAGLLHPVIPSDLFGRHLSGRGAGAVAKAALVGIPLPLCSCGVLPTAIAMRRNGASRAASSSFLIATPQTGVDSIAATWSLLGPAFAIIRPIAALVTAIAGGIAVGKSETDDGSTASRSAATLESHQAGFKARSIAALRYGFVDLVGSIGGWLVVGLIIAALITVYLPADFFAGLSDRPIIAMLAVVIIAVPMYVCATGSIPIALSLMLKGLSPGTALVLLMAGPAANFASFTLISREMGRKAAVIYLAAIVVGAILFGLAIDYLLPAAWFAPAAQSAASCCHTELPIFPTICSAILTAVLINAFIRNRHKSHNHNLSTEMSQTYTVKGMNCPHCQAAVTRAISSVEGVSAVEVNLSSGVATVEGTPSPAAIAEAIRAAGFDLA